MNEQESSSHHIPGFNPVHGSMPVESPVSADPIERFYLTKAAQFAGLAWEAVVKLSEGEKRSLIYDYWWVHIFRSQHNPQFKVELHAHCPTCFSRDGYEGDMTRKRTSGSKRRIVLKCGNPLCPTFNTVYEVPTITVQGVVCTEANVLDLFKEP
jgi:hypothetical protein